MEPSDVSLVAESLTGNREAFGQIVARYQTLICSLAYSNTGNFTQSEDLAQETFVAAWKQLASLREPEKLRSWLCGIVRNLVYDSLKKQGREPSHAAEELDGLHESPSTDPLPLDTTIQHEEESILWKNIERIPEIYREPLVLFYREHQSIEAVAKQLDLNEDAVKQRLSRGRKLLHEQVLAFVEGALERTNPGKTFTIAVIAALPALTLSAKAATLGATAAKGSAAAKTAAASGLLTVILSPLLVIFGNYFGYRIGLAEAHTEEERDLIKSFYRKISLVAVAFSAVFTGLILFALRDENGTWLRFNLILIGLIVIYLFTVFGFVIQTNASRRKYYRDVLQQKYGGVLPKPLWEFRTRAELLGLPLVHIVVGDRFDVLKKPVRAWIAVGNCAVGRLFAFGGLAIAPFSMGGLAIGFMPFGGLSAGIAVLGGFALGVWAYGGLAIGWKACGGCAIGWKSAMGGVTIAHDYAMGGVAHALQANNQIAQDFILSQSFYHITQVLSDHSLFLNLLWVAPLFLQWRFIVRKRAQMQKSGQA